MSNGNGNGNSPWLRILQSLAPVAFALSITGIIAGLSWGLKLEGTMNRMDLRLDNSIERDQSHAARLSAIETRHEAAMAKVLLLEERQRVVIETLRRMEGDANRRLPYTPPP